MYYFTFQMSIMYAVVVFEERNEVEAVPKLWVKGDSCWWPSHLKGCALAKAAQQGLAPDVNWEVYSPVTIIKECGKMAFKDLHDI